MYEMERENSDDTAVSAFLLQRWTTLSVLEVTIPLA